MKGTKSALENDLNRRSTSANVVCVCEKKKICEKYFCVLRLLCLNIRKERRVPSFDLVLLSRDSTMRKIYAATPPLSVDLFVATNNC